jgi:hypothetical protein
MIHVAMRCESHLDGGLDGHIGGGHEGWKDNGVDTLLEDIKEGNR